MNVRSRYNKVVCHDKQESDTVVPTACRPRRSADCSEIFQITSLLREKSFLASVGALSQRKVCRSTDRSFLTLALVLPTDESCDLLRMKICRRELSLLAREL